MLLSIAQELENNTKEYWRLARARNGQSDEHLTVADALLLVGALTYSMNPSRPVCRLAGNLLEEIIADQPRPTRTAKVIKL